MNTNDRLLSITLDQLNAVTGGAEQSQPQPGKPMLDPHGTGQLIDTILVPLPGGGFATMPKPDDAFTRANPPVGAPKF